MNGRRKKLIIGIPLAAALLIIFIVFVIDSNLSMSYYEIETDKINGEIKLALVTDLHSCAYGEGQLELINAVNAQHPDAILLGGDIFDDALPPENTTAFIQGAAEKYPCYYVSGNHEFWSGQADTYKSTLESFGVNVLEGTSGILTVRNRQIRVSGIDDPDMNRFPSRSVPYREQLSRLKEESGGALFTVLLSHRPERIEELLPLHADLVLAGHAHGGQWRLPVLLENGLIAPDQGLFPKYTNGVYLLGDTTLLVSRGLARESTKIIPRVFNRPEIVIITIKG